MFRTKLLCTLVVKGVPTMLMFYCQSLLQTGYALDKTTDVAIARIALSQHAYPAIVLDKQLGDDSGTDLLRVFRAAGDTETALFLAADSTTQVAQECLAGGTQDHLVKPAEIPTLLQRVHRLVTRWLVDLDADARSAPPVLV